VDTPVTTTSLLFAIALLLIQYCRPACVDRFQKLPDHGQTGSQLLLTALALKTPAFGQNEC
jgi:hypothetical protein